MLDLGDASRETFAEYVGDRFRIDDGRGGSVPAKLTEATAIGGPPSPAGRAPFSLLFRAPAGTGLAQGIHRLEHDRIGPIELFLVPLQPDADGARYEAVFA
jgi:hypothetical protein